MKEPSQDEITVALEKIDTLARDYYHDYRNHTTLLKYCIGCPEKYNQFNIEGLIDNIVAVVDRILNLNLMVDIYEAEYAATIKKIVIAAESNQTR